MACRKMSPIFAGSSAMNAPPDAVAVAIASSSPRSTSLPMPMITIRTGRFGSFNFFSCATSSLRVMPALFSFLPSVNRMTELTLPGCQPVSYTHLTLPTKRIV